MSDFHKIKLAVAEKFERMSQHDLFRTAVPKDALWTTYLAAFPRGSNPMYRQRREHDCSCCRHFIRNIGDVVAIIDNEIVSIWDIDCDDADYNTVAREMSKHVKTYKIEDVFLHYEDHIGTSKSRENDGLLIRTWEHFYVDIPKRNERYPFIVKKADIATKLGEYRTSRETLDRALHEITPDAVDTVLELIAQNSIYRGADYTKSLEGFRKLQTEYRKKPTARFSWKHLMSTPGAITGIRGSAIGTLLVDLSQGEELEASVTKFERMMAPEHYKRPTALVTARMVEDARTKVEALGLSLERRYAAKTDIRITNVLFADRTTKQPLSLSEVDDAFANITTKGTIPNFSRMETIPIEDFINQVVPLINSMALYVENKHSGNLVSLVAPVDPDGPPLFKWPNNFSWSYNGDMADSLQQKVKAAGGNVTGDLCCRLGWYNTDDLDLHMMEPSTHGTHIYFGDKMSFATGGNLDVDMNVGHHRELTRTPVENIVYPEMRRMIKGTYKLFVQQYRPRERDDVGFEVEIDIKGAVTRFEYAKAIPSGVNVVVAELAYSPSKGIEIVKGLPSTSLTRTMWGVQTGQFQPVNVFLRSPNYWEEKKAIGNQHYFFMLDGCVNEGNARGFYNEFLRGELDKHRKVIEIVGSKMRTAETPNQLSGLGFSATKHTEIVIQVKGKFTRTLKVLI